MKLLVIGPHQSTQSEESRARQALQAAQVERYVVYTPRQDEGKSAAALRILRQSKKEDFDTVSAQDPFFAGLIAWRVARRVGARLNIQVHTDLSAQPSWRRALARIILRRADSIRAVSEKIKNQVEGTGAKAPVHVLPIYIDISKFKNLVRQPHNQKSVLWVGRFEDEKDPMFALKITANIPNTKLIMLGAGSMESVLRQQAKDLPVEFPGWQDPKPYLAMADVVLCTSLHESFGASIIEALAAGVPVVAPDVGAAKEAGAIVVPREKMKDALIEVLRSGKRGELKLSLPSAQEWARKWKQTL